jgi:2-phosphosulfolactate phosphatase
MGQQRGESTVNVDIGGPHDGRVCIVVDVLRASSTVVTLLERGCERVVVAAHVEQARALKERLPDHLLCGEAGGLPPEGFDYGNSPLEFSRLDLNGKSVILATTNGTRALTEVADTAAAVLVGCLLNLTAVTRAAVHRAEELATDVNIACAGDMDGSEEDFAVGRLMAAVIQGSKLEDDVSRHVRNSRHAETLRRIGLGQDVDYCTQTDATDVVPELRRDERGSSFLIRLPQT